MIQDLYHYTQSVYGVHSEDCLKPALARLQAIDLILVPCWWNTNLKSLVASIEFCRPDLIPVLHGRYHDEACDPIPLNPTHNYLSVPEIPAVGELMLASFPIDSKFEANFALYSWWMGEKYDGVRFCWNPAREEIYTRSGNVLDIKRLPLPSVFIDGEFWFGRGLYTSAYSLILKPSSYVYWHSVRMIAFDSPSLHVQHDPFEARYKILLTKLDPNHCLLIVAPRTLCENKLHLKTFVNDIINNMGEGVMVRKFNSRYENGRSSSLIKIKTSPSDQEGIVVAIHSDKSVQLKLSFGATFTVSAENVKIPTPSIGDIVTFSYDNQSRREIPTNPIITRVRCDLSYDDIVSHGNQAYLNEHSRMGGFKAQPLGYWTTNTMRARLESIARKRGLDPLLAETWYTIPFKEIWKETGKQFFQKFNGFLGTLRQLFPSLTFDASMFKNSWADISIRRTAFERYANAVGFDPLVASNWYSHPQIMSYKKARRIAKYHGDSVAQALLDLFPNIGLLKSKLWPKVSWQEPKNRRKFFENYAKANGFDPLDPKKWYIQPRERIVTVKGATSILSRHNNSVSKAIKDLFPEIGIDTSKFWGLSSWRLEKDRRKFLENYADLNQFDPLISANWYKQSRKGVLNVKGGGQVLSYYGGSLPKALLSLFPDIGLVQSDFFNQSPWKHQEDRRDFFVNYAVANGFDPLDPNEWYKQHRSKIKAVKDAPQIIYFHKKSVSRALLDLFPDIGLELSKFEIKRSC